VYERPTNPKPPSMRLLPLFFPAILLVLARGTICAGEIREFDLKTTERLGREMNRVSQQPDNGAFSLAHSHVSL
jgi:hypothetical protein